ncbi:hypothetical protein WR25_02173 [Diploscapter pachys]|uniref:Uncharacterized protein n=1 Tax=Diploscapter pachys TaxID=2018661 RepID=A0A2A2KQN0_9BILA|nr:hypothetical protein WR25_02173 [Diploscapter pachys]
MAEVKVRIKLVDDNAAEDMVLVASVPDGMTLDKLIEENIVNAGWSGRNLVVKSARRYDKDFNEYVDVIKPYNSQTLSHMQRFEIHLNKETPETGTILADITINGTVQQGQKLVLPPDSTVNDFIFAVFAMFCKDAPNSTINYVKYFDSDFNEFVNIAKPYENVALNFQSRYTISITHVESPTIPNSNPLDKETKLSNENSARHHDIEKCLSQIEDKTPNDEPRSKRAKKDKLGTVNDIYDIYQLNPSLLTDQNDSLISHPDFRLGNIRAAAIECRIFYNRNVCHGINDRIRKTVVFLMAQLFKHDNILTYTAAQKLKPGMIKFPEQVSAKIAAGMIKLIEMKPDSATMGSETDMEIPAGQWTQLIYQEIEHALKSSPTRNTTKPLFKQISDKDHTCKLNLDQEAVQNGWYENASTNYGQDTEIQNAPHQEHAQVVIYNALVPSSFSQTQASNTTGQIIQPWISPSFAQAAVSESMQVCTK